MGWVLIMWVGTPRSDLCRDGAVVGGSSAGSSAGTVRWRVRWGG